MTPPNSSESVPNFTSRAFARFRNPQPSLAWPSRHVPRCACCCIPPAPGGPGLPSPAPQEVQDSLALERQQRVLEEQAAHDKAQAERMDREAVLRQLAEEKRKQMALQVVGGSRVRGMGWGRSKLVTFGAGAPPRDALEGKGPQRWPQKRLDRRLEEVAKAVGGGYCRLQMPLKLALAVRETVAGHRLGALEGGGGYLPPFQCIAGAAGHPVSCDAGFVYAELMR